MRVSGKNVQNSPLVCLISEIPVSHQFLHYYPGSQKHHSQSLMLTFLYLPPSCLWRQKEIPYRLQLTVQRIFCVSRLILEKQNILTFTKMFEAYSSCNLMQVDGISWTDFRIPSCILYPAGKEKVIDHFEEKIFTIYSAWFYYFYFLFQPWNNKCLCTTLQYSLAEHKYCCKRKRRLLLHITNKNTGVKEMRCPDKIHNNKNIIGFVGFLCNAMTPPLHLSRNYWIKNNRTRWRLVSCNDQW